MKEAWLKIEKALLETEYKSWKVFFIYLLLAFIVFFPSYINLNFFWDDERFVFMNPEVLFAPNWFSFWNPKSDFFKTWPLGYSIFWALIKSFPSYNLIFYKTLNILIHTINAFLIYNILKKIKIPYAFVLTLFFLLHPVQVETVSWIFQLLTIISICFFLLVIVALENYINNHKWYWILIAFFFFLFSLWTKSITLLSPFLFLVIFISSGLKKRHSLLLIPFFFASFYIGIQNQKGADLYNKSSTKTESVVFNFFDRKLNGLFAPPKEKIKPVDREYLDYIYKNKSPVKLSPIDRFAVFKQGTLHYSLVTLLPLKLQFIYPDIDPSYFGIVLFFTLYLLMPIFFMIKTKDKIFLLIPVIAFTTLGPYLGLTEIPFFYWSRVSDRYAYFFIFLLVLQLGLILKHNRSNIFPKIIVAWIIFLGFITINYGFKFNKPELLYEEIVRYKPHPVIYSSMIEIYVSKLDLEKSERSLAEALNLYPEHHLIQISRLKVESLKNNLNLLNN